MVLVQARPAGSPGATQARIPTRAGDDFKKRPTGSLKKKWAQFCFKYMGICIAGTVLGGAVATEGRIRTRGSGWLLKWAYRESDQKWAWFCLKYVPNFYCDQSTGELGDRGGSDTHSGKG